MELPIEIEVPGGPRLEARLAESPAATAGLVLCHPHPLYGGDMDNPVIVRAAEVAQGLGLTTLRFNFRGSGPRGAPMAAASRKRTTSGRRSRGLRAALPASAPLGLLGYSFGAWVSARVAAKPPRGLLPLCLVAPPLGMLDWTHRPPRRPRRCSSSRAPAISTVPCPTSSASRRGYPGRAPPSSRAPTTSSSASCIRWGSRSSAGCGSGPAAAQPRCRGSRGGAAVPAERMMRMPSSTLSPVASASSRGTTITSPR